MQNNIKGPFPNIDSNVFIAVAFKGRLFLLFFTLSIASSVRFSKQTILPPPEKEEARCSVSPAPTLKDRGFFLLLSSDR
jgi:hypothetical protein